MNEEKGMAEAAKFLFSLFLKKNMVTSLGKTPSEEPHEHEKSEKKTKPKSSLFFEEHSVVKKIKINKIS